MSEQSLTAFHFRQTLYAIFREALSDDRVSVQITAAQLHERAAEASGTRQKISLCCEVMRAVFNSTGGDVLIRDAEPSCEDQLTIRYVIPRPEWGTWR